MTDIHGHLPARSRIELVSGLVLEALDYAYDVNETLADLPTTITLTARRENEFGYRTFRVPPMAVLYIETLDQGDSAPIEPRPEPLADPEITARRLDDAFKGVAQAFEAIRRDRGR